MQAIWCEKEEECVKCSGDGLCQVKRSLATTDLWIFVRCLLLQCGHFNGPWGHVFWALRAHTVDPLVVDSSEQITFIAYYSFHHELTHSCTIHTHSFVMFAVMIAVDGRSCSFHVQLFWSVCSRPLKSRGLAQGQGRGWEGHVDATLCLFRDRCGLLSLD